MMDVSKKKYVHLSKVQSGCASPKNKFESNKKKYENLIEGAK